MYATARVQIPFRIFALSFIFSIFLLEKTDVIDFTGKHNLSDLYLLSEFCWNSTFFCINMM